ncbi:MAG: hypothetical protein ICV84_20465 [Flavisolibacter sp.]|nr:hypothetical protein [Flavisolibacter sp.]
MKNAFTGNRVHFKHSQRIWRCLPFGKWWVMAKEEFAALAARHYDALQV